MFTHLPCKLLEIVVYIGGVLRLASTQAKNVNNTGYDLVEIHQLKSNTEITMIKSKNIDWVCDS